MSSVWPISASVAALHDASSQLTALTLITDTMNEPTSPLHPSQGSAVRRVTLSDRVVRAPAPKRSSNSRFLLDLLCPALQEKGESEGKTHIKEETGLSGLPCDI